MDDPLQSVEDEADEDHEFHRHCFPTLDVSNLLADRNWRVGLLIVFLSWVTDRSDGVRVIRPCLQLARVRYPRTCALQFCEEPNQGIRRFRSLLHIRTSMPLFAGDEHKWRSTVVNELCGRFTAFSTQAGSEAGLFFVATPGQKQ